MTDNTSLPSISFFSYIRAFFIKIQLIFGKNIFKNLLKTVVAVYVVFLIVDSFNKVIEKAEKTKKQTEQTQSNTATNPQVQAIPETKPQGKIEETKPIEKVPEENKAQVFTAHIDKAINHINEGKYETALEEANKAIGLDYDNAIAYQVRGLTYQHMGRYNSALEDLTKSCNLGAAESCRYAEEVKGKMP